MQFDTNLSKVLLNVDNVLVIKLNSLLPIQFEPLDRVTSGLLSLDRYNNNDYYNMYLKEMRIVLRNSFADISEGGIIDRHLANLFITPNNRVAFTQANEIVLNTTLKGTPPTYDSFIDSYRFIDSAIWDFIHYKFTFLAYCKNLHLQYKQLCK